MLSALIWGKTALFKLIVCSLVLMAVQTGAPAAFRFVVQSVASVPPEKANLPKDRVKLCRCGGALPRDDRVESEQTRFKQAGTWMSSELKEMAQIWDDKMDRLAERMRDE